MVLQAAQMY